MPANQLSKLNTEKHLFSKEAIKLPPSQRLELLLKATQYPLVSKRTSAKGQLNEMIDFYTLCCLMLVQYLPDETAENNFLMLSLMASQETAQSLVTEQFADAFKLLSSYEELESKVTAMQMFFYQYQTCFPDLYSAYYLEELSAKQISDIIQETKQSIIDNPQLIENTLRRWELLYQSQNHPLYGWF